MKRVVCLLILAVPTLAPADDDLAFFERKVRPLLAERCFKCHSTSAKKQKGGLRLDGRDALLKGGDSGPAVVPHKPDDSLLVKAVRHTDGVPAMPPDGRLPERDAAVLIEWIRRGAAFPGASAAATTTTVDIAKGKDFWSFRPLQTSPLPKVRDDTWPRGRLDAFVLARLEEMGLPPAPEADRRTLIRRVTFDLTGLPPTPEQVDAFLADNAPAAYERLVDRLLASPRYGERWARFWLDLARYADKTEEWAEAKAPSAVYRDWVVRALNADLPYDTFARLQLAADLTPCPPEDRAALGFLGLSPSYWKELKLDKDVIRLVVAEEWEERVAAVTGTFLGLTVACARCHDHKFDPISTRDYYGLAGVIASTRQIDRPLLPDAEAAAVVAARARVQALEKEIAELRKKKPPPPQLAEKEAEVAKVKKETPHYDAPTAPGVDDASLVVLADGPHRTKLEYRKGVGQDVAVQVRGNPASSGPMAPRRFLEVLSPGTPRPLTHGSGRLDLAEALVAEAAPLTARVLVNRVWMHHFGAGLVRTPSDFGAQGERPTHPELLDDLARRLVAGGWSLKPLHREIVLSATYRQSSRTSEAGKRLDPDNRLLGRANRRRLEVEAWRDALFAVAGVLDGRIGGPAIDLGDAANRRRTLYGTMTRREPHDLLRLHDVPDATVHSPSRTPTTTPLQGLYVLNSPLVRRQAEALARRLHAQTDSPDGRVSRAYHLLFGREATAAERQLVMEYLADGGTWDQWAQALLGSNEFLFVD